VAAAQQSRAAGLALTAYLRDLVARRRADPDDRANRLREETTVRSVEGFDF
jgi:hypothetical protein